MFSTDVNGTIQYNNAFYSNTKKVEAVACGVVLCRTYAVLFLDPLKFHTSLADRKVRQEFTTVFKTGESKRLTRKR